MLVSAVLLCLQCAHCMDTKKVERDDAGVTTNKLLIREQRLLLEESAVKFSNIFDGDEEKTKCVLRSLVACPSAHLASADRMLDQQLLRALKRPDEEKAQKILALRVNPNCYEEDGETALLIALRCPFVDIRYRFVKALLDKNALPNLVHQNSFSPLHYAVYSYQEAIKHSPFDKEITLSIIKLLVERGARLKFAIFAEFTEYEGERTTPLSFIETQNQDIIHLVKYLMTYVYQEDVYLRESQEHETLEEQQNQIVLSILKRNALLLAMTPWHSRFHTGSASNVSFLPLMSLVNPSRVEQNFKKGILENVKRIMGAPQ